MRRRVGEGLSVEEGVRWFGGVVRLSAEMLGLSVS